MSVSTRMDLNLVRLFIAIYETHSVTAASQRLFLTQSTVSYGLAKLRENLNDQLFVRTHNGMIPTPAAIQIYERFNSGLAQITSAIEMNHSFVPELSERRFRVAMSDIGELIFLPPLLERLYSAAPHAELEVVQAAVDDVPGWLASGKVDAAVGNLPMISDITENEHLFDERWVCLLRSDHPTISAPLTCEAFVAARHAYVSSPFFGHKQVEDIHRQLGIKIALCIPHFTILPRLISMTDLIVVLPSRVAASFASYERLQTLALPIELPQIEVRLHWDRRHEGHAAQQWFLNVLREALGPL